MGHPPTDEQQSAIDAVKRGDSTVLSAYAGCGKTATLEMIGEAIGGRQATYLAFNKAIVTEAERRMPSNVGCTTSHGLAFRAYGKNFRGRLNGPRQKTWDVARILGLDPMVFTTWDGNTRRLTPGFMAGLVMSAVRTFTQSDATTPSGKMIPLVKGLDRPDVTGEGDATKITERKGPNHADLADYLDTFVRKAWIDSLNVNGRLPYTHDHYLKAWSMGEGNGGKPPQIPGDLILFDEAQDANPALLALVNAQRDYGSQLVFVGDQFQQIYAWRGAVNALAKADPKATRLTLSKSFRFGPPIAQVANIALQDLMAPLPLQGLGSEGIVGHFPDPPATWLFRTNAKAISFLLRSLGDGRKVALAGDASDVISFANAAARLMDGNRVEHPDLACFESWSEVQDYAAFDPLGGDLKLMVDLIDEYGVDEIKDGLKRCVSEHQAEIVVSTAHKAKGREWPTVVLAADFPDPDERDISDEDKRLLYVAATRAKAQLDVTRVPYYTRAMKEQ
ncbi:MAG: ATP-dependent helicase [Ilumatobacter sp.]|nr:ATP-dependent helicase [Ilumatobacter sp.]